MASPTYCASPYNPCSPYYPCGGPWQPIIPCTNPEYCDEVFADKCIVHKGNYLPNIDISEGARLDIILTAIDNKFTSLEASALLDFPSTDPNTSNVLTISVPGAADGDIVSLGIPNISYNNASFYTARVSATDTVTISFTNVSLNPIDPEAGIFKVKVIK